MYVPVVHDQSRTKNMVNYKIARSNFFVKVGRFTNKKGKFENSVKPFL